MENVGRNLIQIYPRLHSKPKTGWPRVERLQSLAGKVWFQYTSIAIISDLVEHCVLDVKAGNNYHLLSNGLGHGAEI